MIRDTTSSFIYQHIHSKTEKKTNILNFSFNDILNQKFNSITKVIYKNYLNIELD